MLREEGSGLAILGSGGGKEKTLPKKTLPIFSETRLGSASTFMNKDDSVPGLKEGNKQ